MLMSAPLPTVIGGNLRVKGMGTSIEPFGGSKWSPDTKAGNQLGVPNTGKESASCLQKGKVCLPCLRRLPPSRPQVHRLHTDAPGPKGLPYLDNVVLLLRAVSSMLQYTVPKCTPPRDVVKCPPPKPRRGCRQPFRSYVGHFFPSVCSHEGEA